MIEEDERANRRASWRKAARAAPKTRRPNRAGGARSSSRALTAGARPPSVPPPVASSSSRLPPSIAASLWTFAAGLVRLRSRRLCCRASRLKTFTPWIFHDFKQPSIPPGSGAKPSTPRRRRPRARRSRPRSICLTGEISVLPKKAAACGMSTNGSRRRFCSPFALNDLAPIAGGPGGARWWDKVPSKFAGWGASRFARRDSAPCRARWCAIPRTLRLGPY